MKTQDRIPLSEVEFVVFDTETTGLSCTSSLVELGAVKMKGFKVVDTFHTLARPWEQIPEDALKVHGISQEMVKHAPEIERVLSEFKEFCKGSVLVAHNASFDLMIISVHLQRMGEPLWENRIIDTCQVSKRHFPELRSHSLENLCKVWRSPFKGQHRALHDARHTAFVMSRMAGKMGIDRFTYLGELLERWGPVLHMKRFSLEHALAGAGNRVADKVRLLQHTMERGEPVSYTYLKGGEQKCAVEGVVAKSVFSPGDKIYAEFSNASNRNRSWVCRLDWMLSLREGA